MSLLSWVGIFCVIGNAKETNARITSSSSTDRARFPLYNVVKMYVILKASYTLKRTWQFLYQLKLSINFKDSKKIRGAFIKKNVPNCGKSP